MAISTFDLFSVGIGPSSSHTVGPMRAARQFVEVLGEAGLLTDVFRIKAEMYGSLGATGKGHGTPKAVLLGLEGEQPETVDVTSIEERISRIRDGNLLNLAGTHSIEYNHKTDIVLDRKKVLPFHSNGMLFTAFDKDSQILSSQTYYSVGGGFVIDETVEGSDQLVEDPRTVAYPFESAYQLLELCKEKNLSISELMLENEKAWRSEEQVREGLLNLWSVMQACVANGMANGGTLPGGLNV